MKRPSLLLFATLLIATSAFAQTTIDQAKAMAGQVTPGDAPGFPITLSQPGSYKLTGHLTVPAGSAGIVISADNVTLDLNGFTVSGPSTCTRDSSTRVVSCTHSGSQATELMGIDSSAAKGTVLRNGTVRGFAGPGVRTGEYGRIDSLRATENGWGVIHIVDGFLDSGVLITNSTFDRNRLHGAYLQAGLVESSRSSHNGGSGFIGLGHTVTIANSQAIANRNDGLNNLSVRGTATVANAVYGVHSMGGNMKDGAVY